jgi:hypothetical protein
LESAFWVYNGGEYARWVVVREDLNTGLGSLHGSIQTGIMTKTAVTGDDSGSFSFTNVWGSSPGYFNIIMACVHLSNGVDATSYSDDADSLLGKLTVAGVAVSHVNELILVSGAWGTGSGTLISSDSGMALVLSMAAQSMFTKPGPGTIGTAGSEGLTATNINDAFSGYEIAMQVG